MTNLPEPEAPAPVPAIDLGFIVSHQKVFLDLELRSRYLKGKTEITINPFSTTLKTVKLNCRQARIGKVSFGGKASSGLTHNDPYKLIPLPYISNIHQYHLLQERVNGTVKDSPEPELAISLPPKLKIYELDPSTVLDSTGKPTDDSMAADLTQSTKNVGENTARYTPITISIDFVIDRLRDGLTFAGWEEGDLRYPHVYTGGSSSTSIRCLFPCVDAIDARCTWEISIRTPRTLGDAFRSTQITNGVNGTHANGARNDQEKDINDLSDEDQALDLTVICTGDVTDEIVDPVDQTKKTTSFICASTVSAQHIGFAVGPFEHVNLAAFRESDEDDKLGSSAVPVYGFCLPGRADEVRNTCMPMARAMDYFVTQYGRYPYSTYKMCFVDGMVQDRFDTASLSLCSSRVLFPQDIIDPMFDVTRELAYGLASQWCGIDIIPKEPTDTWAVVGISYYITDCFLQQLMGRNEYRFFQARTSERVCNMDISRPSMHDSGRYLALDSSHMELIAAKAPLVLFILDRRLTKASGSTGLGRIINRVFLNANVGEISNGALSTAYFTRWCERLGHQKLETFFNQWVMGAGCPRFRVTQRFNKKRLVVEMQVTQVQSEVSGEQDLQSSTFMRDVKEDAKAVYAGNLQSSFTGPMTIRIHEADGTPYEHIIEIKDAITRFEVPYSTKYKRLKRTRRHREKIANGLVDTTAEGGEETLLYCLGDVLQGPEDEAEWRLTGWSKEDEDKMSGESYEWIRMDADFEWICRLEINLPGYMFVSQLQQDRDVSAQYDTVSFLARQKPLPLISTILVRTLMDKRYFHGIRSAAAEALAGQASLDVWYIGLYHLKKAFNELVCHSDSGVTISNDFSDRAAYYVQCAILRAIARIRDGARRCPFEARQFLYSKLRENDNSNNQWSDSDYVALMMRGLAEAQASAPLTDGDDAFMGTDDGDDYRFQQKCVAEIDRLRRIDEWIPSYRNVVSIAALDSKRMLAQSGTIPKKAVEYLQYTQDGTNDDLRIAAFSNITQLGLLKEDSILRWFLFVLGHDPSAYVRAHLLALFGRFLGTIATGSDSTAPSTSIQTSGGLIIEEATTETRAADLERKRNLTSENGALRALKAELHANPTLKTALWDTINAPSLTLPEISALLDVCDLLYEPVTSVLVTLQYPRYWAARNEGYIPAGNGQKAKHIVSFRRTSKVRTRKREELKLKMPVSGAGHGRVGTPAPQVVRRESASVGKEKKPHLNLKVKPPKTPGLGTGAGAAVQTPGPQTPGGAGSPATPRGGTIKLKLKVKKEM